ncbi:MAG: DUF3793 family protein [Acholeplasmatales bacterium]|nr:DUF3793 family protein [Acholeplasmatales bacterium]
MGSRLEQALALHCSPALFGIKSSNLINCYYKDFPNLEEDINKLNEDFKNRLAFNIIYKGKDNILLLVYKIDKLKNTLFDINNYNYLKSKGYPDNHNLEDHINFLKRKVNDNNFPHEIGVFLGYDLNDIIDFCDGKKKAEYVGYWKVYSKKEEKIKLFNKYTKCINIVANLVKQGKSLETMI